MPRKAPAPLLERVAWAGPAAPLAMSTALAALALVFARHFAVDWFYNDDLATLRWFAEVDAGLLRPWDLLDLWNNEHPVGAQFALLWLARLALGLDMRDFVLLSTAVVAVTAVLAARLAADAGDPVPARCVAVAACFALAFQPTQVEHLLWSFELGWFVVNATVLADVALAERFGARAAAPIAVLCGIASLASAQGAFAFLAAAFHQGLLPRRRGRAAAALVLALGGLLALLHLVARPHPSASASAHPDRDVAGSALYAVQVLGTLFGLRDHAALAGCGAALCVAAGLLLWRRRHTARQDRWRVAVVLFGFSALCVGAFAQGRHHLGIDWATLSFHAAPLLTPFVLGLAVLIGAPPGRAEPSAPSAAVWWRRHADAAAAAVLLGAAVVSSWPYGFARARLWAMDLGYARWAACSGLLPVAVAARASGLTHDLAGFAAARPLFRPMCLGPASPLQEALIRRPALFDEVARGRRASERALDALWQRYATDLKLQLAFKPWGADTPRRLLAFAEAEANSLSDPHGAALRGSDP